MDKFHYTDIYEFRGTKWIFTDIGWVELHYSQTAKEANKYFSPAKELIKGFPHIYWALSSKLTKRYQVLMDEFKNWSCQCDGFGWRRKCTHINIIKSAFL
jgi:hypothetical protein